MVIAIFDDVFLFPDEFNLDLQSERLGFYTLRLLSF